MQASKTYLNVPFAQKDAAKALGAKWDPAKKRWYAPANMDPAFAKWQVHTATEQAPATANNKTKPHTPKNSTLGVLTYGNNKDLNTCSEDGPPWD